MTELNRLSKSPPMKWTDRHDLELIKDILAERLFDHAKGSRQIGLVWQRIVVNFNSKADVSFNLNDRAVRDKYTLLEKKFKKKEIQDVNASGIEIGEPSEFDNAMEEAVSLFENQEEEIDAEKSVKDDEKSKAKDIRLIVLETASVTAKRKAEDQTATSRDSFKTRKSSTVEYLKEKTVLEIRCKKLELEHKAKELEVRTSEYSETMLPYKKVKLFCNKAHTK